jgi:very-short-patch-repair endonuclease
VPDFAFPNNRLAIYVDGLSFHKGDRLRRDRAIEQKLRNLLPPWEIVRITAKDLRKGKDHITGPIIDLLNLG